MKLERTAKAILLAATAGMAVASNAALAIERPQGYPSRTIEIINPFKAGGSTDVYVRTLVPALEKILNTKVQVVNADGGEGVRAFNDVVGRPADGHTIYAIGPEEVVNTVFHRVDYSQLTPVARVERDQSMYWVRSDSPYKSWADVVKQAKETPNKVIIGGSYGIDQVVTALLLEAAGGLKTKYVPFSVGKEATAALLGGHVDILHEEPGGLVAQIEAKLVRPLIVIADQKIAAFPDAVVSKELGYDISLSRWRGIAVKKGTPPEIVNFLADAIAQAAQSPEYKALSAKTMTNLRPGYLGPAEFASFIEQDLKVYSTEMPRLGLVK